MTKHAPSEQQIKRDAAIIRVILEHYARSRAVLWTLDIVERTGLLYTQVYPRLRRLEDMGHIRSGVGFGSDPRRWWALPAWPPAEVG